MTWRARSIRPYLKALSSELEAETTKRKELEAQLAVRSPKAEDTW